MHELYEATAHSHGFKEVVGERPPRVRALQSSLAKHWAPGWSQH